MNWRTFKHWLSTIQETRDFKALGLSLILVFVIFFVPPEFRSNSQYFERYPVDVFVEVEEPLQLETVELLSIMTFQSLNRTFGYDIVLGGISSFSNDSINEYSDATLRKSLWGTRFSGDTTLYWSITNGRIQMYVKCFTGIGPERNYHGKDYRGIGISNYGNKIGLFFNSSKDLSSEGFLDNYETYLHEFGHAFGMVHQLDSHIMYSPEVDPENIGSPNTTHYRSLFQSGVIWPNPNGTADEIMLPVLAHFNGTIQHFMPLGSKEWFNRTNPLYTTDITPVIIGYVNESYILCLENSNLFTVLWIHSTLEDTPEGYYWHQWKVMGCVVPIEGDW
jgi:hypothetical protein